MRPVAWSAGRWTHDPEVVDLSDDALVATAAEGSDAWRTTAYGFVHATEHALVSALGVGEAMEITFTADWSGEFDQAGIFVRADEQRWVKAGLEYADGHLGLGAVVTDGVSDWSVGRTDTWRTASVSMRVSRWDDALIIRARTGDEVWRLVRVAPFAGGPVVEAGPYLCAPTRAGFTVAFRSWLHGDADESIH